MVSREAAEKSRACCVDICKFTFVAEVADTTNLTTSWHSRNREELHMDSGRYAGGRSKIKLGAVDAELQHSGMLQI